ncbi:MAG: PD-(D/E)XK nuclease family protein [Candidatus Aenigmarchaeota archaeon]|nr:PD-(D/E)XK nuclease family protein [Candidatus Aenigmarchaeota archaeon]
MRIGVEINERIFSRIFKILNDHVSETVKLEDLLLELLENGINSSDYLFLILSKLEKRGFVKGGKGQVEILKVVDKETRKEIKEDVILELERNKKIFVTPLEVAKFYQCPRRLYLEKVTMSRQFKKERGRVWDGEALHLSAKLFVENLLRAPVENLIERVPSLALEKYKGQVTINKNDLKEFLRNFYDLINQEKFKLIFTERTLESLKLGLVGTPDIIAKKENGEYIAIDIKLGKFDRRKGVKKEHLLQNIGEALLIESFFRTRVKKIYLVYFQSNTVVDINLNDMLRDEFLRFKKSLERVVTKNVIPRKSKLPNAKNRVCKGCHVKPVCENIEELLKLKKRIRF